MGGFRSRAPVSEEPRGESANRWGRSAAGPRDDFRRDAPREDFRRDAPREEFRRDAPREEFRRDAAPRQQEERTFSREAFGTRAAAPRQQPAGDRDWGAMRSAPRQEEQRDFRRREEPSVPSRDAAPAPAADGEDGFTEVKKTARR